MAWGCSNRTSAATMITQCAPIINQTFSSLQPSIGKNQIFQNHFWKFQHCNLIKYLENIHRWPKHGWHVLFGNLICWMNYWIQWCFARPEFEMGIRQICYLTLVLWDYWTGLLRSIPIARSEFGDNQAGGKFNYRIYVYVHGSAMVSIIFIKIWSCILRFLTFCAAICISLVSNCRLKIF